LNVRDERTKSLWMRTDVLPDAPLLQGKHVADTVIVGSGMAGLSAAYELTVAGKKVIVVDRGSIAGGMTSRTTAHLAPICDDGLCSLINRPQFRHSRTCPHALGGFWLGKRSFHFASGKRFSVDYHPI